MRTRMFMMVVTTILLSGGARAQSVSFVVPAPPTIQFVAPPPLVEVSPGVQVVADRDEEIYFVGGWYWVRHGKHWFRARDHRGGWAYVDDGAVPETVVVVPQGKYKHYKPGKKVVLVAPDGEVVKYKMKKVKFKKQK
jgi:hypothetical protein